MTMDTAPAVDWTSLGQSFADAYSELDANDYLGTLDTEIQEDLPEPAVVDAEEPDGTDKLRQVWLRPVEDLRSFFPHEASNLTPWIAKRLQIIRRAAWFENPLTLVGTEQKIAGYRIDILAKTLVGDRERFVVIENQMERTDADHLGRLITCAATVEASHAVWITTEFRDDHLKVMEALQRNHRDCSFIPLVIDGAFLDAEGSASFKLVIPPTYSSPDDHLREKLHEALRQAQEVNYTLDRLAGLVAKHPDVDFSRYRDTIEESGWWSNRADRRVDKLLEAIPVERRKRRL
ncbi:hypothetical protein C8250_009535 [Streptomyces sp. So13.3]|uniref:hypothetical protein n=1 Tax=Streptomyces sp. So13.3 TaxID=2136173 RepID=UPI001105814A|nr:hypothetical protein [Streptomyces sp. So13.3]QNA72111.1 hypothetical protein C8250_009535 [Streptomyces sp. So13.3]